MKSPLPLKPAPSGSPVLVDTPQFRGRSVRPSDASQALADWFADPARVGPLNLPPRQLDVPDLRRFFSGFDNRSRFLIALIAKEDERICGFYHAEFHLQHRLSRISFLNGPNLLQARRAMIALGNPLLDLQFRRFKMEKIVAQVLESNAPVCRHLDRLGFQREGFLRAQVRSPTGEGRLNQVLFGLLPQDLQRAY